MEYKTRKYPQFSPCGLNCGLCPRYHTVGSSRCPGCAGEGFSDVHPPCGVLSCNQRRGLEYCFECDNFPCKKYDKADSSADSFITHRKQMSDMEKARQMGMDAYAAELNRKIEILEDLIENYNDGRRKGFYCLAVNLLEFKDVEEIMANIKSDVTPQMTVKEKAAKVVALFQSIADEKGIYLKLQK